MQLPLLHVKAYTRGNLQGLHAIDTAAQTWRGQFELSSYFTVPLHIALHWTQGKESLDNLDTSQSGEHQNHPVLQLIRVVLKDSSEVDELLCWVRFHGKGLGHLGGSDSIYKAGGEGVNVGAMTTPEGAAPREGVDAIVVVKHKIRGTFLQAMELSSFPFDAQALKVDVLYASETCVLARPEELGEVFGGGHQSRVDALSFSWSQSPCNSEWGLLGQHRQQQQQRHLEHVQQGGGEYRRFLLPPHVWTPRPKLYNIRRIHFLISRHPFDVLFNVLLPTALLTALGLITALGLPDEAENLLFNKAAQMERGAWVAGMDTGDLGTTMSVFLALIGVKASASHYLPAVSVVTRLELYTLLCLVLHGLAICVCGYKDYIKLYMAGGDGVHNRVCWALYGLFLAVNLYFSCLYLVRRERIQRPVRRDGCARGLRGRVPCLYPFYAILVDCCKMGFSPVVSLVPCEAHGNIIQSGGDFREWQCGCSLDATLSAAVFLLPSFFFIPLPVHTPPPYFYHLLPLPQSNTGVPRAPRSTAQSAGNTGMSMH